MATPESNTFLRNPGNEVAINAAIAIAAKSGNLKIVTLENHVYIINSPIMMKEGVTLDGNGATLIIGRQWNDKIDHDTIVVAGRPEGNPIPLTAEGVKQGQDSVPISTHDSSSIIFPRRQGFLPVTTPLRGVFLGQENQPLFIASQPDVDGWHLLYSLEPFHPKSVDSRKRGELVRAFRKLPRPLEQTTSIQIEGMTRDDYGLPDEMPGRSGTNSDARPRVTARAWLQPVHLMHNCQIRNLSITQEAPLETRKKTGAALRVRYARNCVVENCHFHHLDGPAIILESAIDSRVQNCEINDLANNTAPGEQRFGYGVLLSNACENVVVSGNRISRVRHGVDTGEVRSTSFNPPVALLLGGAVKITAGVPRATVISGNVVSRATNSGISWHTDSAGVTVTGNVVSNCLNYGIYCRGTSSYIQGNTVEWCGGGISVGVSPGQEGGEEDDGTLRLWGVGTQIVGNIIRHTKDFSNRKLRPEGTDEIKGTADGGTGHGIQLQGTEHVNVVGNTISDCWGIGILLRPNTWSCIVANNVLTDVAQDPDPKYRERAGIELGESARDNVDNAPIAGNVIKGNLIHGSRRAQAPLPPGAVRVGRFVPSVSAALTLTPPPGGERLPRESQPKFGIRCTNANGQNFIIDNVAVNLEGVYTSDTLVFSLPSLPPPVPLPPPPPLVLVDSQQILDNNRLY